MKKRWMMVVVGILFFSLTFSALADEGKEITGWIYLKTDTPTDGSGNWAQSFSGYAQYGNWGVNLDAYYDYKTSYREAAPFLVYNKGPWYFLAGFLANSENQSFVPAGFWYCNKLWGIDYFIDVRNYFGLNGAEGYLDSYLGVTYPLGKKWHIGFDVEQYHYWRATNDIFLAGPVLKYKLTKNLQLCVRPTREWSGGDNTDKVRIFLLYEF